MLKYFYFQKFTLCSCANKPILRGFRKFLTENFGKISLQPPKVTSIGSKKSKFSESVLKVFGHEYELVPNRILGPQHSARGNATGFAIFLSQKYYHLGKPQDLKNIRNPGQGYSCLSHTPPMGHGSLRNYLILSSRI